MRRTRVLTHAARRFNQPERVSVRFLRTKPWTNVQRLMPVPKPKADRMCATGYASVFTTGGLYVDASNPRAHARGSPTELAGTR